MTDANQLSKNLKNIGPKMATKMLEAGIDSPDKLRKLGARKAFELMYEKGDSYGDYNAAYLHALEGAIRDCDWQDIPAPIKEEHQTFAKQLQRGKKSNS